MADRALYKRTLDGFRPANDLAASQAQGCKLGDIIELKPTKVRNGKFHRLFFAILKLISENSNPEITPDQALYLAKAGAGVGDWITTPGGKELFVPGSISFARMDQVAFDEFVKASIPPLVTRFMRGTAPDAVIAEAMEIAA
jgi:hypothetical protein